MSTRYGQPAASAHDGRHERPQTRHTLSENSRSTISHLVNVPQPGRAPAIAQRFSAMAHSLSSLKRSNSSAYWGTAAGPATCLALPLL